MLELATSPSILARHTHSALLIADGWHPLAISSRLGYSTIPVTMDSYGHLLPGLRPTSSAGPQEVHRVIDCTIGNHKRDPAQIAAGGLSALALSVMSVRRW